ncbi:hypothetical protein [Flavobacterium aestivum]|uniref:hypothetical protein n=1 Tax=Flavobacterium aestivum TaxID=3003257 RepID=UPI00228543AF|nr:hypothetical protein [Flavobacterium aestivum]
MKSIIYTFLILFLISCNDKKQEQLEKSERIVDRTHEIKKSESASKYQDTLKIKYQEHKDLLDILTVLPDSTMESWGWEANERVEFVKTIKKNNCIIGTNEHFSNIALIKPNTMEIQVVDGRWTLSIYEIKPSNYIVITDDIVGDGNDIKCFEYDNGKLVYIKMENLFGDFFTDLLIDKENSRCVELLDDNKIGFEYNFKNAINVEISNSFYLKENENGDCLKGNILKYQFNKKTRKFDLLKIDWIESKK